MAKLMGIFIAAVMVMLAAGCRKQVSTLHDDSDKAVQKEVVTPTVKDLYKNVDTSDATSFVKASLSDDLSQKVREALQTVYFEYNSAELTPETISKLQKAASFMKDNIGIRILISGHCDERGSSDYNMGLGENRARAIKEYLMNYGIESIRLETTSMGKEQPAAPNCGADESCHAKNRRAEFTPLSRG